MRQATSTETERTAVDRNRSLGGALAFLGLLAGGLLTVSYPTVMLGVTLGLLLGLALPRGAATARRLTRTAATGDLTRLRPSG